MTTEKAERSVCSQATRRSSNDWFIGGFDTADLKDAKTLLDELNG
jgi:hypothetical protein